MSALRELCAAYADRLGTAAGGRGDGVIGYVGADVPVELLTAAGVVPLRLFGDPDRDRSEGDRYLGPGVDPVARSALSRLLAKDYPIDRLVVSRDCEASLRLFYAVRELRRVEPGLGLPETYLVDLGHLPHRTTTTYNTVRIGQFRDRLADWVGRPLDDDALAAAVAAHDEQRALLTEVATWRHAEPAGLTGSQFLAVVGAGTAMPVAAHLDLLRRLLVEGPPGGTSERRAFVTGSGHDTDHVYRALEARGIAIVGEDHDWGEAWFARPVGAPTVPALAERYQYRGPAAPRATVAARAAHTAARLPACGAELLVCYGRGQDEAPPWDFVRQAAAAGRPTMTFLRQPYGQVDAA